MLAFVRPTSACSGVPTVGVPGQIHTITAVGAEGADITASTQSDDCEVIEEEEDVGASLDFISVAVDLAGEPAPGRLDITATDTIGSASASFNTERCAEHCWVPSLKVPESTCYHA